MKEEIIRETCAELSVDIIEMELMPDHVHLLLEVDPRFGIHKTVKQIKGASSRIFRQEFQELRTKLPTLWTNSYFVSTVGGAPLKIIRQYIESQKLPNDRKPQQGKGRRNHDKQGTRQFLNYHNPVKTSAYKERETAD